MFAALQQSAMRAEQARATLHFTFTLLLLLLLLLCFIFIFLHHFVLLFPLALDSCINSLYNPELLLLAVAAAAAAAPSKKGNTDSTTNQYSNPIDHFVVVHYSLDSILFVRRRLLQTPSACLVYGTHNNVFSSFSIHNNPRLLNCTATNRHTQTHYSTSNCTSQNCRCCCCSTSQ